MKKFVSLAVCILVGAGVLYARAVYKKMPVVTVLNTYSYFDTSGGTRNGNNKHGSGRTDTFFLNRAGNDTVLDVRDFSAFRAYTSIGPVYPAETAGTFAGNGGGLRDTIIYVLKRKLGTLYVNIDSQLTTDILRRNTKTFVTTFNGGSETPAADSLWASDLMVILTIADSVHDTSSGTGWRVPLRFETSFKE